MSILITCHYTEKYYCVIKGLVLRNLISQYFPHYTSAHATGECGTVTSVGVPDEVQSINRCAHTEMETIEWQWHEVIALINALCPQSKLLNRQWHVARTVRAFCFFTLIGCFDQRQFGDPASLLHARLWETAISWI